MDTYILDPRYNLDLLHDDMKPPNEVEQVEQKSGHFTVRVKIKLVIKTRAFYFVKRLLKIGSTGVFTFQTFQTCALLAAMTGCISN